MGTMTSAPSPLDSSTSASPRRAAWRKWLLAAVAVIMVGYAIWQLPVWQAQAQTGAAYGARMGCSCRFVQRRDIESCRRDAEPGMEIVSINDVEGANAVQASVPVLASRTARFRPGTGCVLDDE